MWCHGHKRITVGAWILLVVGVSLLSSSIGKKDQASFRLANTESQRAYDLLGKNFPVKNGDTDQFVFKARTGTLRDPATRSAIQTALAKVAQDTKVVAAVVSPFQQGGQLTRDG